MASSRSSSWSASEIATISGRNCAICVARSERFVPALNPTTRNLLGFSRTIFNACKPKGPVLSRMEIFLIGIKHLLKPRHHGFRNGDSPRGVIKFFPRMHNFDKHDGNLIKYAQESIKAAGWRFLNSNCGAIETERRANPFSPTLKLSAQWISSQFCNKTDAGALT